MICNDFIVEKVWSKNNPDPSPISILQNKAG